MTRHLPLIVVALLGAVVCWLQLSSLLTLSEVVTNQDKRISYFESQGIVGKVTDIRQQVEDITIEADKIKKELERAKRSLIETIAAQELTIKASMKDDAAKVCDNKIALSEQKLIPMIKRRQTPVYKPVPNEVPVQPASEALPVALP